jgi:iron complex outermembrane receptor protein
MGDDSNLRLRGDFYTQSKTYFSNLNDSLNPGTRLPGYSIANFRLDFENVGGSGLGIGAWVKNAFKEKYYVGGLPLGLSLGVNSGNVGRPRMYGMELSYKFAAP